MLRWPAPSLSADDRTGVDDTRPDSPGKVRKSSYELYQQIRTVPGAVVEAGVFRGGSFTLWAMPVIAARSGRSPMVVSRAA